MVVHFLCMFQEATFDKVMSIYTINVYNHVLQHLQEEVHNQQVAFEELQKMAAQVQGADSRLVSLCTQLNTRYQTAKTSLRVSTFSSRLY